MADKAAHGDVDAPQRPVVNAATIIDAAIATYAPPEGSPNSGAGVETASSHRRDAAISDTRNDVMAAIAGRPPAGRIQLHGGLASGVEQQFAGLIRRLNNRAEREAARRAAMSPAAALSQSNLVALMSRSTSNDRLPPGSVNTARPLVDDDDDDAASGLDSSAAPSALALQRLPDDPTLDLPDAVRAANQRHNAAVAFYHQRLAAELAARRDRGRRDRELSASLAIAPNDEDMLREPSEFESNAEQILENMTQGTGSRIARFRQLAGNDLFRSGPALARGVPVGVSTAAKLLSSAHRMSPRSRAVNAAVSESEGSMSGGTSPGSAALALHEVQLIAVQGRLNEALEEIDGLKRENQRRFDEALLKSELEMRVVVIQLEGRIDSMQKEIADRDEAVRVVRGRLADAETRAVLLERDAQAADRRVDAIKAESDAAYHAFEVAKSAAKERERELQEKIESANRLFEGSQQRLGEEMNRAAELTDKLHSTEGRLNTAIKRVRHTEELEVTTKEQHHELLVVRRQIGELTDRVDFLETTRQSFAEETRAAVASEIADLQGQVQTLTTQRDASNAKCRELTVANEELSQALSTFESQRKLMRQMHKELTAAQEDVQNLRQRNGRLIERHHRLIFENIAQRLNMQKVLRPGGLVSRIRDLEEQNGWLFERLNKLPTEVVSSKPGSKRRVRRFGEPDEATPPSPTQPGDDAIGEWTVDDKSTQTDADADDDEDATESARRIAMKRNQLNRHHHPETMLEALAEIGIVEAPEDPRAADADVTAQPVRKDPDGPPGGHHSAYDGSNLQDYTAAALSEAAWTNHLATITPVLYMSAPGESNRTGLIYKPGGQLAHLSKLPPRPRSGSPDHLHRRAVSTDSPASATDHRASAHDDESQSIAGASRPGSRVSSATKIRAARGLPLSRPSSALSTATSIGGESGHHRGVGGSSTPVTRPHSAALGTAEQRRKDTAANASAADLPPDQPTLHLVVRGTKGPRDAALARHPYRSEGDLGKRPQQDRSAFNPASQPFVQSWLPTSYAVGSLSPLEKHELGRSTMTAAKRTTVRDAPGAVYSDDAAAGGDAVLRKQAAGGTTMLPAFQPHERTPGGAWVAAMGSKAT